MTQFLLKCFFVSTVLFFGVLLGIQFASNNIVQMTGDSKYSTAHLLNVVNEQPKEQVHTDILSKEEKLTSHDLAAKQKKLEEIETFNLFSQIGVKLSDIFNKIFSSIFAKLTATIGNVLT